MIQLELVKPDWRPVRQPLSVARLATGVALIAWSVAALFPSRLADALNFPMWTHHDRPLLWLVLMVPALVSYLINRIWGPRR